MRPIQWSKNLLIFVPGILASHTLSIAPSTLCTGMIFCLVASGVCIFNDLHDLAQDQQHPIKKNRPLASGNISKQTALVLASVLLITGLAGAYWINPHIWILLVLYSVANVGYSLWIKKWVLADVMLLSSFYVLRLWVGAVSSHVPLTNWFLVFGFFLFLSLGFLKRFCELKIRNDRPEIPTGRGYRSTDQQTLWTLGVINGYLSVLVLGLFIEQSTSHLYYKHPLALWIYVILLMGWLSRLWFFAHRGDVHDDPITFVITDPLSWGCLVCGLAVFYTMASL